MAWTLPPPLLVVGPLKKNCFCGFPYKVAWLFIQAFDIYSVMQSDGNRFYGYVVLDSFNMAYRHEDSVLDQKYEKQISRDRYYKDFEF